MTAETDVFLRKLLEDIIAPDGSYSDDQRQISFSAGSETGDGFTGVNRAITIKSPDGVLNLFAKTAPKNETLRNQINIKRLFAREIDFYRKVQPEFLKFQVERGVRKPFDAVARCHATSTDDFNEALVFDDLRAQGYVLFDKKIQMNEAHVTFVFKLYARFHAISYAMKQQEPVRYAKLTEDLDDLFTACFKSGGFDVAIIRYAEDARKLFDPVVEPVVSDRIKNLPEIFLAIVEKAHEFLDDYSVITHGDCWCNNFMFKYKDIADPTTLEDIKIIDWQVMRMNSPVFDLSCFFYSTATKEIMADLDFYMKTYHQALSESIMEMGGDPEKSYPYSVFVDHWKRFSRYGLVVALMALKVMVADKEEMPKTFENVDAGKSFADAFEYEIKNKKIYNERVRDLIEHFVCKEFI